ncbi:tyrosine-type recombinase/integrase [Zafaria sp. Z1313]|uniref:tyrosine-type recombinase/integrase n=1 Tax=Zafaria sp. Z1313 TaxID=3423202 RepID=UPI003D301E70
MASIRREADGTYTVRYRKPDRGSTMKRGFRTKRDAEAFAATVEVSKLKGEFISVSAGRTTVGDLGEKWLANQAHLKPSTLRVTESAWAVHVRPRWGSVQISDILHTEVQTWLSAMSATKSATLVIRCHGILAKILDNAVMDRMLSTNPARGVKLPRKAKKEHVYLTHEQVHALAGEAKHPLLVLFLAYTGLRWGEATGLRIRDVNPLRRRLNVVQNAVEVGNTVVVGTPKTHERRSVPYPEFLAEALSEQMKGKLPDDLLFAGADGGFLTRTGTSKTSRGWFVGALQRAGLPRMTPHELRHTAASLAISAGANVKAVQRMLGHASATMTLDTYADLFEDDLDSVGAALDHAASQKIVLKTRSQA